jgi:prophage maintenance system killer protein
VVKGTGTPHESPLPIEGSGGKIVLYQAGNRHPALEVRLDKETVWLSQRQMAELFDKDSDTVGLHIRNILKEGELEAGATTEDSSVVQMEGSRRVRRRLKMYNLDMILSVGYRVNSKRGTQFRIWATGVLRDHLVKGYSLNEKRLKDLRQSLRLVGQVLDRHEVSPDQARALLRVVTDYAAALDLLDDYDHQRVSVTGLNPEKGRGIGYDEALSVVKELRRTFGGSDLFGREKDLSFEGTLRAIMQTFDGEDVYPSIEEKAAHLLYFLVKNHHFVDGNKRIAAALFLWFMEKNGILYRADGSRYMADNALVAITLMIAESDPKEKDILTRTVVNLIKDRT